MNYSHLSPTEREIWLAKKIFIRHNAQLYFGDFQLSFFLQYCELFPIAPFKVIYLNLLFFILVSAFAFSWLLCLHICGYCFFLGLRGEKRKSKTNSKKGLRATTTTIAKFEEPSFHGEQQRTVKNWYTDIKGGKIIVQQKIIRVPILFLPTLETKSRFIYCLLYKKKYKYFMNFNLEYHILLLFDYKIFLIEHF